MEVVLVEEATRMSDLIDPEALERVCSDFEAHLMVPVPVAPLAGPESERAEAAVAGSG